MQEESFGIELESCSEQLFSIAFEGTRLQIEQFLERWRRKYLYFCFDV